MSKRSIPFSSSVPGYYHTEFPCWSERMEMREMGLSECRHGGECEAQEMYKGKQKKFFKSFNVSLGD